MKWLTQPESHDYDAAADYLSLLVGMRVATETVRGMEDLPVIKRRAKDILRASKLQPLPAHNRHVAKDLEKTELSPVLLVRTPMGLEIADGYHRVSAVYHIDEDSEVHCKLTSLAIA